MADKEKKKHSRLKIILIALIIIIAVGCIAASGGSDEPEKISSSSESTETAEQTPESTDFTIGDTADFNGIQISLTSAILSNGSDYFHPDEGKYFLGLIFEINNGSSSDITISSIANFEAYVDDYSVNQDITGYQAPEWDGFDQLDGSVAAGKKMNGVIVYQVPRDFQNFEISVNPDFWSSKKVTFTVPAASADHSSVQ